MFDFSIKKNDVLGPLLTVSGAVDKRQSLAILSNFLLKLNTDSLEITATDLEIEISARVPCQTFGQQGQITIPAKKFIDILRSLDEDTEPKISCDNNVLTIKQGRSTFKLTTLPADHYPVSEDTCNEVELTISRVALLDLLQATHFAMAQQDVRIFLNGLLLEFEANSITSVATDGHRMAIYKYSCSNLSQYKLLLPKKGVQELLRILNSIDDEQVILSAGTSHFKLSTAQYIFSSKLIDARFPPYTKAIPKNQDKQILMDCATLKKALTRIIILAHEKSRAVMIHLQPGQVTLIANNNEQEEAEEVLPAETQGSDIKIGLNATYLLDVLNHFNEGQIRILMSNNDSSILIESVQHENYQYIIMPMKI